GAEPVGDVCVCYTRELKAVTVAADEIPSLIDEIPILALLATACKGETRFCEVGELRVKESDRLAAVIAGLTALGCSARAEGDDLVIEGHEGFMSDTRKTRLPIHTLSGRQLNQSNDSPAGSFASGFALRSGRHEEGLAHIDERHEEGLASNEGPSLTTPSALLTHNDHRLAMTWIVAARAFCIDLDIEGIESMGVSYPGFSNDLESLSATRAIT
ncbi:MAG: hypothetical protein FWD43_01775, partial [Coriobacteriia bacterium]|nr:hypothetical protein [Coriobacteriia bacterium]